MVNPLLEEVKSLPLNQGFHLNRIEGTRFLGSFFTVLGKTGTSIRKIDPKPVFNFVVSLKRDLPLSVPILRELSALGTGRASEKEAAIIKRRLERVYLRMRRIQEELVHLDLKKAAAGVSPEDFIFSRIDFSRYREIEASYFEALFLDGQDDFDETFLKKAFGLERKELKSIISEGYRKTEGFYKILKENPVILSVMRCLETSLENSPLFSAKEIEDELNNLMFFLEYSAGSRQGRGSPQDGRNRLMPGMEKLYPLLVFSLDGVCITHGDGMETTLFITGQGELSGTFRPANKPWTRVLIPGVL